VVKIFHVFTITQNIICYIFTYKQTTTEADFGTSFVVRTHIQNVPHFILLGRLMSDGCVDVKIRATR
jgi:hypothetical protein